MPHVSITVDILAAPARVWAALVDVEHWPDWTTSVTSVERLDAGPLQLGSRTRLRQPKLDPAVWLVTDFNAAKGSFAWESRSLGTVITAGHQIIATTVGSSLTLTVSYSGFLASLAYGLTGKLTWEYARTEAHGLKRFCEAESNRSLQFV